MSSRGKGARREGRVARLLVIVALSLGHPSLARLALAQTARPTDPAALPLRDTNFAWDQDLLRASFSFTDVMDDQVKQKLSNGTTSTVAMRAYVFREGETNPVMLAVQTCKVTRDLWEDVFAVQRTTKDGTTTQAVANVNGVERSCAKVQDFAIAPRSAFRAGVRHYLAVIVDVNPVSDDVRAQLRQWMQRPLGSADVGGGDAIFSGAMLLVFRDVGGSDRTVQFRTRTFVSEAGR